MRKSVAAMLVLMFSVASCLVVAKPAFSSAEVAEDTWVAKAPMSQARAGLGVAVVNGKIYDIGGNTWEKESAQHTTGGVVGTNEEYDPATDTWTFKASMPTPREAFAIAVCQNKIYCIGGNTSSGVTGINEVYDPATDIWENKASLPNPRYGIKANAVDGKIYLIGGYVGNASSGYSYLTLNDVYDPATDSWSTKAPMPTAVSGRLSAVVDGKIYVLMPNPNLNQIYDTKTDSWSLGAPLPYFSMVYASAGATIGVNAPKRIYIIGNSGTLDYDPINDKWTNGATIPTDREGFGVAVVNDILYAIGGYTATYQNYPEDWMFGPTVTKSAINEQYTPLGYGTVPPVISVVSPEDQTYNATGVDLVFAVNKPAVWLGYSLDGQDNVTVTGNTTINGLSNGLHNITVYAKDEFENTGASETITFSVEAPFPVAPVAAASVAAVAVIGVGLLVYFRKRSHRAEKRFVKKT